MIKKMDLIGIIPPALWNTALDIAREKQYPIPQPQNCPNIILLNVNEMQKLALGALHTKQLMHIYLIEICHPNLKPKDHNPIAKPYWEEARQYADNLLAQAIPLTSSTINQPNTKRT